MYVVDVGESKPWNDDETRALVSAYFSMLEQETRGAAYSKIAHNRHVQSLTGRSKGSIEFKFCNISHVLAEAGLPYVAGYKPRSHVQEALRAAVLGEVGAESKRSSGVKRPPPVGGMLSSSDTPGIAAQSAAAFNERGPLSASTPETKIGNSWYGLAGLWDRATGGTDVAARPDHPVDSSWPSALRPAGVEEACEWLKSGVSAGRPPRFLFLVGGPGAGKSHATAHVVHGMRLMSELEEGLAHRIYDYEGTLSDLVVVNDATINLEASERAPLTSDIDRVVGVGMEAVLPSRSRHLMACVNRGVLVEEMSESRLRDSADWTAGDVLVRWLYGSPLTGPIESSWQVTGVTGQDFVRSARLSHMGEHVANVMAVFVDECSLFEERPAISIGADSSVSAEEYRIVPLTQRPGMEATRAPAADLLVNVLKAVEEAVSDPQGHVLETVVDPLGANLQSLRSPLVRSGLLTMARSAELMSATRMTYRELWGFLTRALVGDAPSRMPREHLGEFVMANQPSGLGAEEDFERMRILSALRFNQSIFGAGERSAAPDGSMRDPVLKLLIPVDPVSDAVPGSNPDAPGEGWATRISDAFGVHASDGTPLQSLLDSAVEDGPLHAVVTDFDRRLDEAFCQLLQSPHLKDEKRLEATGWYGAYLTRLYAVSHGICAFRREVDMLIRTWVQSPHLPDDLKSPLRTLIRPKRNPTESGSSLLPLFDSRTEPITGRTATPKLAVRVREPELSTDRQGQGEQVLLVIGTDGTTMSRVSLDFPLIREALACVDDHIGVTDLIDVTAPRLERVRASRLLSSHLHGAEFCLADGDREVQITQRYTKES
ncbi:hypothetical protein [Arthrobacter sp. ISL-5]|uniref:hypothetical protein n=1 Tax=Arthrobacter sp. ISL-5 TaxID=2819111 RepID=UPI001BE6911E|nr:hypothetical protein [Arthrobacter sp. ISL-5]MBT2554471.1 hypothetical protein [Arthrobacter sp. ISL-5]